MISFGRLRLLSLCSIGTLNLLFLLFNINLFLSQSFNQFRIYWLLFLVLIDVGQRNEGSDYIIGFLRHILSS